jgi:Asp-tRNA(Asn)/Glu-tRNA(Gln) amidotransferase A subunit family amidase
MDALPADFLDLELTDLAARIETRAISPLAVTRALLDRIASLDESAGANRQAAAIHLPLRHHRPSDHHAAGGFSEAGLPIGFRLIAAHLAEATLVRAGAAFQGVTDWHRRRPLL